MSAITIPPFHFPTRRVRPSVGDPERLTDTTVDPDITYRPVPFWSWNEEISPAEIRRQIDLIGGGGWGGAFVHARVGLTTPYLGDDWFKAVDATVDACARDGMRVWLYDEDTWPSGFSGGSVPRGGAEHRMKALIARPVGQPPPPHCQPIGPAKAGVQVYCWTAPLSNPWFYGHCYADILNPPTVERFLDDAYRSYHARYGELYGKTISAQFTDEPSPIFRLGLPRGAVPFSAALVEHFEKQYGHSPLELLPRLFVDGDGAATFRVRFYRAISELFETNFSARIGNWCREHKIALTGHFMSEHSLYDQLLWGSAVMPNYRHQEIPGIDHLARQVHETLAAKQCQSVVNQYGKKRMLSELYGVSGQGMSFADRWWIACQQIGLGVNLLNPHLALYTMAGCRKRDYPPNLFYQQPWWPLNSVLDDKLSRLCQIMSQGQYAADILVIHPQETASALWRGETALVDAEGVREDVWDHHATAAGVKDEIDRYDASFKQIIAALLGAQRMFDLGDEKILSDDGEVRQRAGRPVLQVGQMAYAAIVVPPMATIRPATLALIERFAAAGGVLVCVGDPPALVEGVASSRAAEIFIAATRTSAAELPRLLDTLLPPALHLHARPAVAASVITHVRHLSDCDGDTQLIYLTNLHRAEGDEAAGIDVAGTWPSAQRYDPLAGCWHVIAGEMASDRTRFRLPLLPTQTHVLRLGQSPPAAPLRYQALSKTVAEDCEVELNDWSVDRLDENALTLDAATWREGDGEPSPRALPIIAIQQRLNALRYAGPLTLRYTFAAADDAVGRQVRLVVEYPQRYQIRVNGQLVVPGDLPYWRDIRWSQIDITKFVVAGNNTIELHCAAFEPGVRDNAADPAARYGTEIESIYLVGDFAVTPVAIPASPHCPRWQAYALPPVQQSLLQADRPLTIGAPAKLIVGDLTRQGLPFYAGRIVYRTTIPQADIPRRLRIDRLDAAIAEVALNGQVVGHFITQPLEVTLPAGGGELSITLSGTLRNLLGPHHHPEGELPAVAPPMFEPKLPLPIAESVLAWAAGKIEPGEWAEGWSLVSFGELGRVTLSG